MVGRNHSIRTRFTTGLIAATSFVAIIFAFIIIKYNTNDIERQLQGQIEKVTAFSQETLSIALWQYNYDYIKRYLDSLFLFEHLVFAHIQEQNRTVAEKSVARFNGKKFTHFQNSSNFITSEVPIIYKESAIGKLQIVFSREQIRNMIVTASFISLVVLALINLSIIGVAYLLSNRYVFKPLLDLERSVKNIAAGNLDQKIEVRIRDEVGQLALSFKQMMDNLKNITASRDELNHEIKERIRSEKMISQLNGLNEQLLGSDSFETKLKFVAESVLEIIDADFSRIWILEEGDHCRNPCAHDEICSEDKSMDGKKECLHLKVSCGRYTHTDGDHSRIPKRAYRVGHICSEDLDYFITNDVQNDSRIKNAAWAKELGLRSFCGLKLFNAQGDTGGVLALFSKHSLSKQDVEILQNIATAATEVIQAEITKKKLADSEKKFRDFFENAQVGMYRADLKDGKIIESNQRMAEILGYDSIDDFLSRHDAVLQYVDSSKRLEIMSKLNAEGIVANHALEVKTQKGKSKWIEFSGVLSEIEGCYEGVAIDITDKKQAEEKVNQSLLEKEILLKEIHHRVKNNMQIIQSLLSLQANEVKDTEYDKLLTDSNNRIRAMALIHEILYNADDISKLDLNKYFNQIISNLSRIYATRESNITTNVVIEGVDLNMDHTITCGLILNELVTNSFKYGLMNHGMGALEVTLKKEDENNLVFIVSDNGPGLPPDFDIEQVKSLGLKIVKILVSGQLKGTIDISSTTGTSVIIRFSNTDEKSEIL